MNGARWPEVKRVFHAAAALSGSERARFVEEACAGDSDLRREVESLLAWSEREDSPLDRPAEGLDGLLAQSLAVDAPPERLGPYRILRKIGDGGMGAVFLAERDDGVFQKQVAIKLIQPGLDSRRFLDHFTRERNILARLEHPNITRLVDGGATPEGHPYLVMEYVDGRNITEYCRDEELPIAARLRLFLKVCDAVSYAHRNLIVHRDLKPGNILVTSEGDPKLLDFGLARLLDPLAAGDATRSLPWMTPRYASPEQVRGEAVTVATDVYSLGVILYELLAGKRPYEVDSSSPLTAARTICESEPPPPSAAAETPRARHSLKGDLDNIALRALEKDPARRYPSVERFAADMERYLQRRPVEARRASVAYRVSKFVRRHRTVVALSALALLAMVGGAVATEWQARRAERGFNDVRLLADSMLFPVYDAIRTLPGATPARELLVQNALKYLNRASLEAAGNEDLQRDLAAGYQRIGDVQGEPGAAALGQWSAARESYHRAVAFYLRLLERHPRDYACRRGLAHCYSNLALLEKKNAAERLRIAQAAVAVIEAAPPGSYDPADYQSDIATARFNVAQLYTDRGEYERALQEFARSENGYRASLKLRQSDNRERNVALTDKHQGALLSVLRRYDEAIVRYETARAIDSRRVAAQPNDAVARMDLSFDLVDLGFLAHRKGDHVKARDYLSQAVALRETVAGADPKDVRAQSSLADALGREALELRESGDLAQAEEAAKRSIAILSAQPSLDPDWLASSEDELAQIYFVRHQPAQACALLLRARDRLAKSGGSLSATARKDLSTLEGELAAHCPAR